MSCWVINKHAVIRKSLLRLQANLGVTRPLGFFSGNSRLKQQLEEENTRATQLSKRYFFTTYLRILFFLFLFCSSLLYLLLPSPSFFRLSELTSRIKVRDDQVTNLTLELERQREHKEMLLAQVKDLSSQHLYLLQVDKTAEEWTEFEQRLEDNHQILKEIGKLKEQVLERPPPPVISAVKQGEQGEEWVLECLRRALPTNTSICR